MKRNLIYTILAATILVVVYSFTITKPYHKHVAKAKPKKCFTCTATVSNIQGTYNSSHSITITWSSTGASSFTYGGNFFCSTGSSFGTTATTSNSATITIPGGSECDYSGINGRIIPFCADGTAGTGQVFSIHH